MVQIRLVPIHLARKVWEELHTQLKGAMRYHPAMTVDDLLVLLERNMLAMFAAIVDDELAGCFIVNIEEFPQRRVCNIIVVAGKNGKTRGWIFEMLEEVEKWAASRGCDLVAGIGRKGWMVATEAGFRTENRAILVKEIDHARWRRRTDSAEPGAVERGTAPSEAAL